MSCCVHVLALLLLLLVGCNDANNPQGVGTSVSADELSQLRTKYITSQRAEETVTIPRLRKKLSPQETIEGEPEPEPPPESLEVVVAGKICKQKALADNPDFPWQPGKAAFMMIDPAFKPSAHAEEHADGEECPFCQQKEQDAQALVQITDEDGEVLNVDARELFEVTEDQKVVVTGTASLLAGMLVIDATSVHVVR